MFSLMKFICRACGRPPCGPDSREPSGEKVPENPANDLTAIRGIGIATQNRLNTSGIKTYAQLAEASPDDLQKILGGRVTEGKIKHWIAEARTLAEEANK